MCNPFDLNRCDENLQRGFWGKLYSKSMANNIASCSNRKHLFQGLREYEPALVRKAKQFEILTRLTRVTFGFSSVDAYYEASGSKRKIAGGESRCYASVKDVSSLQLKRYLERQLRATSTLFY